MKKYFLLSSLIALTAHCKADNVKMLTQALELAAQLPTITPEQKAAQEQKRADFSTQEETNRKQLEKEQAKFITKLQKEQDRLAELRKEEQEEEMFNGLNDFQKLAEEEAAFDAFLSDEKTSREKIILERAQERVDFYNNYNDRKGL